MNALGRIFLYNCPKIDKTYFLNGRTSLVLKQTLGFRVHVIMNFNSEWELILGFVCQRCSYLEVLFVQLNHRDGVLSN